MDLADYMKMHWTKLRCGNPIRTIEDRKESLLLERKMKRETDTYARRNIDANMSPYVSPFPKRNCNVNVPDNRKKSPAKNYIKSPSKNVLSKKRLEMLAVWKTEKEKKKRLEKAKQKPIFKVCHVTQETRLNLDNVNRTIKGKLIPTVNKSSQFAPKNHVFVPPKGLSTYNFANNNFSIKTVPQKTSTVTSARTKPSTSVPHGRVLRSAATTNIGGTQEKKVNKSSAGPINTRKNDPSKERKQVLNKENLKNKALKQLVKGNSKKNGIPINIVPATSRKNETVLSKEQGKSHISKATPVNMHVNETPKTLATAPVYISPFVTQSRGKDKALQEFKICHKTDEKKLEPAVGDYLRTHTSPQNGADYFMHVLNSEIDRIKSVYEKWEEYLESPDILEEATSSINVAVGQSKLLITKKFNQFRNLIIQCQTQKFNEKTITCEDLHGFWDMLYIQVENLDKRFANLDRLKETNWVEMLPEKKLEQQQPIAERTRQKVKGRGGTKPTASSRLKDMIKAAREKQKNTKNLEEGNAISDEVDQITTPLREQVPHRAISNKRNLGKSILKPDGYKSTGKKSVVFRRSMSPSFDDNATNTVKQSNTAKKNISFSSDDEKENTPRIRRRSARLSMK
ncbi:disks large-associated protein 5-like [Euwallacea similis]|uniref:disks large-associated protein 5-like n=1 Tax=Euwallacea similis TaxID=1736056 RepID=UPI00344E134F